MKRVYKYGTGEVIPEDAEYLTTIVQEEEKRLGIPRLVWHYFLVDDSPPEPIKPAVTPEVIKW